MLNIKAKTVDFILNNLKEKKIKYAVLRNFEKLPDIGRDLDILVDNNIKEIQRVILKSAKKFNWTHLILDQSKSRYFSPVFQFQRLQNHASLIYNMI